MNTLCSACADGDVRAAASSLEEGIDVNDVTSGASALAHACKHGHIAVVTLLLQQKGIDVNVGVTKNLSSPLLIAASLGHSEVLHVLAADRRTDLNKARRDGLTPLIISVQQAHAKCVSALCSCPRLKVNARTLFPERITALHIGIRTNNLSAVRLLLSHPAMDLAENTYMRDPALQIATELGDSHAAIADLLQSYMNGVDPLLAVAGEPPANRADICKIEDSDCTSPSRSLEMHLRGVLLRSPIPVVSAISLRKCEVKRNNTSVVEIDVTLCEGIDASGPVFAGSLYSLQLLTASGLAARWFKQLRGEDVGVSVRSTTATHSQPLIGGAVVVTAEMEPPAGASEDEDTNAGGPDCVVMRCTVAGADRRHVAITDVNLGVERSLSNDN